MLLAHKFNVRLNSHAGISVAAVLSDMKLVTMQKTTSISSANAE